MAKTIVTPDQGGTGLTSISTLQNANAEGADIKSTGATDGHVLTADGSGGVAWEAGGSGSGDITSVVAGTGLTGGATSGDATLNVDVGIADDKVVQIDASDVADDDFARFTANGLEGRSASEVLSDIGASASGHTHSYAAQGANSDITSLTGLTTALTVAQGGTGATSLTDKAVLISQDTGTDAIGAVALTSNGQIIVGGADGPAAATITAGTNVSVTNAANSITIASTDQYTGTVTSVGGTGTVNGLTLTGTVTGSGSLTLGGTLPVEIGIACSDETTALTTGDNKARFMIPEAMTLTEVKASLSGADTGGVGVEIDVRYHATDPTNAGATVFSGGDLTIDDTYYYGTNTSLAVTSLAENSFIMVDINTVDDATGLKIWLIGTK